MMSYDFQSRAISVSVKGQIHFEALARTNDRRGGEPGAWPHAAVGIALSRRQEEVLRLLTQGLTNKEIARVLGMAQGTVKVHVAALFHKLGVSSRTAAAVVGAQILATRAAPVPSSKGAAVGASHLFGPVTFSA